MELDLSFIKDTHSRNMIINGHHAVTRCEAWDFLKNFSPGANEDFMFTGHPKVYEIGNMMESCPHPPGGHSGSSFAWTMRQLESIAKDGYIVYKNKWIRRYREEDRETMQEVVLQNILIPELPPINENPESEPEILPGQ
jgi:hypothetical protein